ncbi:unnamed protein product [Polarella glacialis]|uniref:Peptidase C1A papain C-terminal domain-containing protein n=1 Tax=Polarella glacialis TaxID=89957 RepID=A0A813J9T8_POLGL|nr:unnamed protein product [Polarella glacialis]
MKAGCGRAFMLQSSFSRQEHVETLLSAVLDQSAEVRLLLQLCESGGGGSSSCGNGTRPALAEVSLQVTAVWDEVTQGVSSRKLRFLGTIPPPCQIVVDGTAVTSGRALRTETDESMEPRILGRDNQQQQYQRQLQGDPQRHRQQTRQESGELPDPPAEGESEAQGFLRLALVRHGYAHVPEKFDFRVRWPLCSTPVRSQGACASSWALAAVGAWEKQACALIGSSGTFLSAQWALDCSRPSNGCAGGKIQEAFHTLYAEGAVPETCDPDRAVHGFAAGGLFDVPHGFYLPGRDDSHSWTCQQAHACVEERSCAPLRFGRGPSALEQELLSPGGPGFAASAFASSLRGAPMIQAAILAYGAVVSLVEVYIDFLTYKKDGGVYRRAEALGPQDCLGLMAVQLIGWGGEAPRGAQGAASKSSTRTGSDSQEANRAPVPAYWLGEASFGSTWGDEGLFRWARGEDHLGIERRAALPFVATPGQEGEDADVLDLAGLQRRDMLSLLEAQELGLRARLSSQQQLRWWLLLANLGGLMLVLLAGLTVCLQRHFEWPCDAHLDDRESDCDRPEQYLYQAVPSLG